MGVGGRKKETEERGSEQEELCQALPGLTVPEAEREESTCLHVCMNM